MYLYIYIYAYIYIIRCFHDSSAQNFSKAALMFFVPTSLDSCSGQQGLGRRPGAERIGHSDDSSKELVMLVVFRVLTWRGWRNG